MSDDHTSTADDTGTSDVPPGADWITTPFTIAAATAFGRGALEWEHGAHGLLPHRLPARIRARNNDGFLALAASQPSGVRLVFRTRASLVELDALRTKMAYRGAPERPDGVYDLLVDGRLVDQRSVSGGNQLMNDMAGQSSELVSGPVGTVRFAGLPAGSGPDGLKTVELWLPHNEVTEIVTLRTDAPVEPVGRVDRRAWVHHGSSISHGSNAASPSTTWPACAASLGGVELTNLGYGGSAMLDSYAAQTLRDTPADLLSVKLGINVVNADVMRLRALTPAIHGFLDTIREGHPRTPLLVISPVLCPIHEDTPGPTAPDYSAFAQGKLRFHAAGDPEETATGKLTLRVVREELARVVEQRAADDPWLYYLDGRELYGQQDYEELPLPDDIHPDAAAHRRMGERFAVLAFGPGGPFATADAHDSPGA